MSWRSCGTDRRRKQDAAGACQVDPGREPPRSAGSRRRASADAVPAEPEARRLAGLAVSHSRKMDATGVTRPSVRRVAAFRTNSLAVTEGGRQTDRSCPGPCGHRNDSLSPLRRVLQPVQLHRRVIQFARIKRGPEGPNPLHRAETHVRFPVRSAVRWKVPPAFELPMRQPWYRKCGRHALPLHGDRAFTSAGLDIVNSLESSDSGPDARHHILAASSCERHRAS